jgi:hypothetical protein
MGLFSLRKADESLNFTMKSKLQTMQITTKKQECMVQLFLDQTELEGRNVEAQ